MKLKFETGHAGWIPKTEVMRIQKMNVKKYQLAVKPTDGVKTMELRFISSLR